MLMGEKRSQILGSYPIPKLRHVGMMIKETVEFITLGICVMGAECGGFSSPKFLVIFKYTLYVFN